MLLTVIADLILICLERRLSHLPIRNYVPSKMSDLEQEVKQKIFTAYQEADHFATIELSAYTKKKLSIEPNYHLVVLPTKTHVQTIFEAIKAVEHVFITLE